MSLFSIYNTISKKILGNDDLIVTTYNNRIFRDKFLKDIKYPRAPPPSPIFYKRKLITKDDAELFTHSKTPFYTLHTLHSSFPKKTCLYSGNL